MTISAQSIVATVQDQLTDLRGIRWSAVQIVADLNDGQREIASVRPDATARVLPITLVDGAAQSIPASARALLDLVGVPQVQAQSLDAFDPGWRSRPKSRVLRQFMVDSRNPRAFDVDPPAMAGTLVNALLSLYPVDVPTPAGRTADTVSGSIALNDEFKNALIDWCLFRAWSKDAEFGGNLTLSQSALMRCSQSIGVDLQARLAARPKVQDDSLVAG